jgi:hypothetical protein
MALALACVNSTLVLTQIRIWLDTHNIALHAGAEQL